MGVLDGKVAVITGSSHGLGFAIAEAYEKKLKPLSAVIRLWAKPLSVPAEKAVWLASPAPDKKTGLDIQVLGTGGLVKGLLQELRRIITRRPAPDTSLSITSIVPYKML